MPDHNVIWNVTRSERGSATAIRREGGSGIMTDGTDAASIAHNLFGGCENAAIQILRYGQLPTAWLHTGCQSSIRSCSSEQRAD
ncbi:MAG: hypothetical protein ABSF95_13655 [Verrucomicrobiota bacterium]